MLAMENPPFFSKFLKWRKHSFIFSRSVRMMAAIGSSSLIYSSTILWQSSMSYLSSSYLTYSPPLSKANYAFSCAFYFLSLAMITPGSTVSLRSISFLIRATLIANLQVDILSGMSSYLALIVAIMRVLQLPPIESLRISVISDSL